MNLRYPLETFCSLGTFCSRSVRMNRNCIFGILFYLMISKNGQASDCDGCSDYLISGPRGISDDKLTASSVYPYDGYVYDAKYGRLYLYKTENPTAASWSARISTEQQYIQAEFSKVKLVRAIATQGRSNINQWVTSYSVSYSIDGSDWSTVKDGNKDKIFLANNDRSTIVTNFLPKCIEAKYVRLQTKTWYGHVSMRFDVIGCSKVESKIPRRKVNWKRHPIIFSSQIQQDLTQVFEIPTQEINICAVKCQQNSLCQTFSLKKSGMCAGYEEQIYQGDIQSFSAQEEDAYFISTSQLEDKEYEIVESLNLCYKIMTSNETAGSASAMCKREKAKLLSIRNLDEMNVIKNSIKNNLILSQQVHFYVDGSQRNGLWKYATDKDIPTTLWSPSHPRSGDGGCVTMTMNGLETHNCSDSLYFICGM